MSDSYSIYITMLLQLCRNCICIWFCVVLLQWHHNCSHCDLASWQRFVSWQLFSQQNTCSPFFACSCNSETLYPPTMPTTKYAVVASSMTRKKVKLALAVTAALQKVVAKTLNSKVHFPANFVVREMTQN